MASNSDTAESGRAVGHLLWEIEVEERHIITESGVETYTDIYVPEHADSVTETLAQRIWDEFGKDAEDDLGLNVVSDDAV